MLIRYNTQAPWIATPTIQTNGNHHHFFILIPILAHLMVQSVVKTHVLIVTVELIWWFKWLQLVAKAQPLKQTLKQTLAFLECIFFNSVPTPNKSLRFTRFRWSYLSRTAVVLANHCQSYTAFLLDVRCSKLARSFFLQLFSPNDSTFA